MEGKTTIIAIIPKSIGEEQGRDSLTLNHPMQKEEKGVLKLEFHTQKHRRRIRKRFPDPKITSCKKKKNVP